MEKGKKKIRIGKQEDELLLLVSAQIYSRRIRELVYSRAPKSFIVHTYVTACRLKGVPRGAFLEKGNSEEFLSGG